MIKIQKKNIFYYEENKNFLLKFTVEKNNKCILIECLNTKRISKKGEMFSNIYKICDILNISEYNKELDVEKSLRDLFNKKAPKGVFNDQNEFKLTIFQDDNVISIFVLINNKCTNDDFIKKNIEKKIKQHIDDNKTLFKNIINENKNLIEEIEILNDKLGIKFDINNSLTSSNDLIEKALKSLLKLKIKK